MLFDNDSFRFKVRQVVEKDRNSLINSCFDHRNEIASFLKSYFHDVNEIEKRGSLNINSCSCSLF